MESNFNNRDFEQFVKQNADQYRMFPSEKVWKNIHSTLHTRRRWYGIGLALLLLTSGTVTWVMLSSPGKDQPLVSRSLVPSLKNTTPAEQEKQPDYLAASVKPVKRITPFTTLENEQPAVTPVLPGSVYIVPASTETISLQEPVTSYATTVRRIASQKELLRTDPAPALAIGQFAEDNYPDIMKPATELRPAAEKITDRPLENYPPSIESVVNTFRNIGKRKKLTWEIYFAPTISYRKLSENKDFLRSVQSTNNPTGVLVISDVNSVVTHKPDMGLELGFKAGYPLGKNVQLTAGFQFNVNKYDIKAFTYPTEVTTIALDAGTGSNSVSTMTNYRNFSGYKANWLHNLYVTTSLPIGADFKLTGDKRSYWGIGATIQPTYIIGDRAYLISTDYKNYAEVPSLIRRWNVNTSFETYAGYSTGKVNWRIGPQVRYQLRSSFEAKYPVKENLFDFGLKVGIMLNQ